jgi:hypothetical protein
MSKAMQQSRFKTTFYIDEENKKRMDSFVSSRKKTEFINQALAKELVKLEEQRSRQELVEMINNIVPIKSDEPVVETIRKMRSVRQQQLTNPDNEKICS